MADCATRSSPPVRARRRWRVALRRAPAIEATVLVDERSAGFFALGAAQATGAPVALLCTSGTRRRPTTTRRSLEADESAVPLVVLKRRPAAGASRDRRRADDRPDQALRLRGALVLRVGTHEADDDGLLHYRSVACRAFAAPAARPGPGRSTSICPGASRWRRSRRGSGDRHRPAGAGGSRRAPADRGDADRPRVLGLPARGDGRPHRRRDRRRDRRRPPARPGAARPLATWRASPASRSWPSPTSQLRCGPHDRSRVISAYDQLLRDERFARSVVPDLVLRFGEMPTSKPLRAWLAASGADRDRRRPRRRLDEPTRRARRSCEPTRPSWRRAGRPGWTKEPSAEPPPWIAAEAAAQEALDAELGAGGGIYRAGSASGPGPGTRRRRPRLHRLEHADPRPGGFSRQRRRRCPLPQQPRRQRHRRPDLLGHWRRPRQRPPDHDPQRRPRPAPRPRRPRRPARCLRPRSASSSSTTTAAASSTSCRRSRHWTAREFEALFGTPRGVDVERAAALFGLPHRRLGTPSPIFPKLSAPAPA